VNAGVVLTCQTSALAFVHPLVYLQMLRSNPPSLVVTYTEAHPWFSPTNPYGGGPIGIA